MSEEAPVTLETSDTPVENAEVTQEVTPQESPPEPSPEDKAKEREEFPEKAKNALEKHKRKIGKLHAQFAQERERASRMESVIAELTRRQGTTEPQGPSDSDPKYKTYGEFLDDKTKYTAETIVEAKLKAFQEQQQQIQHQQRWVQERTQSLDSDVVKLKTDLPDYDAVISEHAPFIAALPQNIKLAALSVENAALAAYQLAKEDAIEDLADMTPDQAKSTLAAAAKRGLAEIQAKKISRAPAPLSQTRGASSGGSKSLENMSADQLLAWVSTKR